ncbi:Alpha-L-fucosidase [Novipirellula aureliae]|uniref:alpha-L-fucosidase n=1 Tax=Novipirellula aureliae TaxID=2527966 RepID=A0A5C6DCS2_9BACT|nr:alpha-L-fucosidase [Novipirellula aureliae]TWU34572.1 Alpha-L-fucosidase [Novipirellula aureliae]
MKRMGLIAGFCLLMGFSGVQVNAQTEGQEYILNTESAADKQERMAWWKEARFGMFVHWGLYSSAEGEWGDKTFTRAAEWIQRNANVSADVYQETMLPKFKPAPDFASKWASLAKQAGAKYVVFTNKHHEGFALHDSTQTEYDAKDVTGRDLHKEVVEALRAEGLRVGVYHSLWDWHHPDAPAGKGAMNVSGLTMEGRDLSRYTNYLHAQVNEITDGRYGDVDVLWLDYSKGPYQGEVWRAKQLVELIRNNQPQILINNRLWQNTKEQREDSGKYWFGDFSTPEQHIPATGIEGIDWETCDTLNITWGWSKHAVEFKTSTELIHRLIDAVSKGGNYLLNIGPLPDGSIDPKTVERFSDIGEWMQINGDAIYGTQAGPFSRLPWGRATAKEIGDGGHRLYLHVFDWPANGELLVPGLQTIPTHGSVMGGKAAETLRMSKARGGVVLEGLPTQPVHDAATVIAIDFDQVPSVAPYRVHAATDGSFDLEPADATVKDAIYHDHEMHRRSCIDSWKANAEAQFPLQVEKSQSYAVQIEVAADKIKDNATFALSAGEAQRSFEVKSTGGGEVWKTLDAGSIELPSGPITLTLRCATIDEASILKLATITLKPVASTP